MKLILNSNLLPIISVGMYESHIDPRYMFDDYQMNQDFENGDSDYNAETFWDNFNNAEYVDKVQQLAKKFLDNDYEMDGITVRIRCGQIYSPQYYNFATDQIDLAVQFDKRKILKFAKDNYLEFSEFLKENYSSYDGFCSFTANTYITWKERIQFQNRDQEVGAILTFWFKKLAGKETYDEFKELAFVYYASENLYSGDFYNEPELLER